MRSRGTDRRRRKRRGKRRGERQRERQRKRDRDGSDRERELVNDSEKAFTPKTITPPDSMQGRHIL
jgi:hypothetical protein